MAIAFNCKHCGKQSFHVPSRPKKFCSKPCYTAYQKGKPRPGHIPTTGLCEHCGELFAYIPSVPQRFCSLICSRLFYDVDGGNKRCSTCKEIKPVSDFYRDRRHRSGYALSCKDCEQIRKDKTLGISPEERLKRTAQVEQKAKNRANGLRYCPVCESQKPHSEFYVNPDGHPTGYCKSCDSVTRRANKDRRQGISKEERARRNNERRIKQELAGQGLRQCGVCGEIKPFAEFNKHDKSGRLRSNCKCCEALYKKGYHKENMEHILEKTRQWIADNPERSRLMSRVAVERRRARKLAASGTHTAEEIVALWHTQQGRCVYCRCRLGKHPMESGTYHAYHADHIIPLSRSGSNSIRNIQLLCRSCNSRKHNKMPDDFAQERGLLMSPKPGEYSSQLLGTKTQRPSPT